MDYNKLKKNILNKMLNADYREAIECNLDTTNNFVMLSCPHSVEHFREGVKKFSEPDTVVIAKKLHKDINIPYIYKIKSDNEDANYDKKSTYKDMLSEYIKKIEDIKLLLDLHELNPKRKEIVNFGIGNMKNINDIYLLNILIRNFSESKIGMVSIDKPFAARGERTISSYIHKKNKINTIQIEFNSKIFRDNDSFDKVYKTMKKSINELNEYLIGEKNEWQ